MPGETKRESAGERAGGRGSPARGRGERAGGRGRSLAEGRVAERAGPTGTRGRARARHLPEPARPRGLADADGQRVVSGAVFRSTDLSRLAGPDVQAFAELGIRPVFDLRTELERRLPRRAALRRGPRVPRRPGRLGHGSPGGPDGAPDRSSGGHGALTADRVGRCSPPPTGRSSACPAHGLRTAPCSAAFAANRRPALIHCTAGKDRTGWAVAALLLLLGVADEDVMTEYMITNELLLPVLQPVFDQFREGGGDPASWYPSSVSIPPTWRRPSTRSGLVSGRWRATSVEGLGWTPPRSPSSVPCSPSRRVRGLPSNCRAPAGRTGAPTPEVEHVSLDGLLGIPDLRGGAAAQAQALVDRPEPALQAGRDHDQRRRVRSRLVRRRRHPGRVPQHRACVERPESRRPGHAPGVPAGLRAHPSLDRRGDPADQLPPVPPRGLAVDAQRPDPRASRRSARPGVRGGPLALSRRSRGRPTPRCSSTWP